MITAIIAFLLFNCVDAKQANIFLENGENIGAVEKCFAKGFQSHECALHGIRLVKSHPGDFDLAIKMGNLIALKYDYAQALHVYSLAFSESNQSKLCQMGLIQESIVKALNVPAGELPKKANEIIIRCWPSIQSKMVKELEGDQDGFALMNGCGILKQKSALSGILKKKCERSLGSKRD